MIRMWFYYSRMSISPRNNETHMEDERTGDSNSESTTGLEKQKCKQAVKHIVLAITKYV
jgi:stress response protein SCP2